MARAAGMAADFGDFSIGEMNQIAPISRSDDTRDVFAPQRASRQQRVEQRLRQGPLVDALIVKIPRQRAARVRVE
ncbi:MAG: hypothetical protein BWZ10_03524 [candidate division BRC1 bacterium ADurb.BinA364]|nr:MAG: hypothetical protein BWZ10_03524 [candidate division BRC1 bacterium ADurb.BinA364]